MAKQEKLDIEAQKKLDTIDKYTFEPIKGYPMLHWKGKRPFNSTQFYPAQLKENYGNVVNGWMNKIFWGDNLQVMSHLLKEFRGEVNLIYLDPPFDSKADYKKKINLRGKAINNDQNSFEEKQYTDIWNNDEFLQFIFERIILIRELLAPNGSIILHCDPHKSQYLRCILDEVFGLGDATSKGSPGFRNEIIWCYAGGGAPKTFYQAKHDNLFWYSKSNEWIFNKQYRPYSEGTFRTGFASKGMENSLNENGAMLMDWWNDCPKILSYNAKENQQYPTQKPESLLKRIILGHTNPGDVVFDCFMGSGTTQAVAMKLGRRFLGADINLGAIETTIKRLNNVIIELNEEPQELEFESEDGQIEKIKNFYSGFSVYNVNNYDVFRNPVEAKELLKQALEIQPLPNNNFYDGEKDGRMVKIMPINRIATRADLNELISGFNYKSFEKNYEKFPNRPVEKLLLICMGHEPDLAASLQKEVPFKLDIEVVDILRDKSNLEFKRDSEAEVLIKKDKLIIRQFYPMNLLQKLSIQKENVENWKELTESVKIDFNFDGAVFEPQLVDIPETDELVKGEYSIPKDAGTIRLKITDLLSESLELTIDNK